MQSRLKSTALGLILVAATLAGCGQSTATTLPLPPAGGAAAPAPDLSALNSALYGTPGPTPVPLAPDLPPGSGRLVYSKYAEDSPSSAMLVPASGGPAGAAAFDPQYADWVGLPGNAAWSPDRRSVLFTINVEADDTVELALAAGDGSASRRLVTLSDHRDLLPGTPVWSPDGSKAAIVLQQLAERASDQTMRLVVVDIANASATMLVEDPNLDRDQLAWSPDSATVAFSTYEDRDTGTLQTIRWDGTDRKTLVKDSAITSLFWPSDGAILYAGRCDRSNVTALCRLDPASGEAEPLYRTPEEADILGFISISPDEQWLFAQEYRRDSLLLINRRTGAIETISATRAGLFPQVSTWSPDSKYLAVVGQDELTYVYEVGSGQPLRPLISERVLGWLPER